MRKDSPKKKVTIDDLAVMVARGFAETKADLTDKIDSLDNKLSSRIDDLEGRFDDLEGRFDTLEQKVDRIDSRLTNQLDYVMLHYSYISLGL